MQEPRNPTLAEQCLTTLAEMGDIKTYRKNEILITEGEKSDALFILVAGQLKVFTRDPSGRELVYNILEPGEILGEMFLDGGARSASVKAIVPSECIVLAEARIHDLIREQPNFAECLIQILIARLRRATHMIKDLVLNDVYGRTTTLLSQVAVIEGNQRVVPRRLTQQEIADRVGATREMINHVIAELIKDGLLVRDEKRRLVFTHPLPSDR